MPIKRHKRNALQPYSVAKNPQCQQYLNNISKNARQPHLYNINNAKVDIIID